MAEVEIELENVNKILELIPEYNGSCHTLTRFINKCDEAVCTYVKPKSDNEFMNSYIINHILNKITGPIADAIKLAGVPENWDDLKNILINNFANGRDEASLCMELCHLEQGFHTPEQLYNECVTLLSTIITYVTLHDITETVVASKRKLYSRLALQAFVRGLNEPLGSHIRCMRPETIEQALSFVQEELNITKLQRQKCVSRTQQICSAPLSSNPFVPFKPLQRNQFGIRNDTWGLGSKGSNFISQNQSFFGNVPQGQGSKPLMSNTPLAGSVFGSSSNVGGSPASVFGSSTKSPQGGLFGSAPSTQAAAFGTASNKPPHAIGQCGPTGYRFGKSEDAKPN